MELIDLSGQQPRPVPTDDALSSGVITKAESAPGVRSSHSDEGCSRFDREGLCACCTAIK